MNILVTAIGSMSAECVISQLKNAGHFVIGCDIYPGEWHYESQLCDIFCRSPFAIHKDEYVTFLLETCQRYSVDYLIPLTDLEIDVIDECRSRFNGLNVTLCMQNHEVLYFARNKYELYKNFYDDPFVPSIRTSLLTSIPKDFNLPCIAKPYNGRSSEGLIKNASRESLDAISDKAKYIVQEQIDGDIFTVDYVRNEYFGHDAAVPRRELLRTKNGAGLTVEIVDDKILLSLVSHIGQTLKIKGCVNMEFIKNGDSYYLIDINPRFSAGVAFSFIEGYNMVLNHMYCFFGKDIDPQITIKEQIITKKYKEVIL